MGIFDFFFKEKKLTNIESISHRIKEIKKIRNMMLTRSIIPLDKFPKDDDLDWLENFLLENYNNDLPKIFIYPNCSGHIQLEWGNENIQLSLEINFDTFEGDFFGVSIRDESYDKEKIIKLENKKDWKWLLNELNFLKEKLK